MFGVGYHILLLSFLAEDTSLTLAYVLPKDVGRLWKAWSSTMHACWNINHWPSPHLFEMYIYKFSFNNYLVYTIQMEAWDEHSCLSQVSLVIAK
jgi:hypothetical protein